MATHEIVMTYDDETKAFNIKHPDRLDIAVYMIQLALAYINVKLHGFFTKKSESPIQVARPQLIKPS